MTTSIHYACSLYGLVSDGQLLLQSFSNAAMIDVIPRRSLASSLLQSFSNAAMIDVIPRRSLGNSLVCSFTIWYYLFPCNDIYIFLIPWFKSHEKFSQQCSKIDKYSHDQSDGRKTGHDVCFNCFVGDSVHRSKNFLSFNNHQL